MILQAVPSVGHGWYVAPGPPPLQPTTTIKRPARDQARDALGFTCFSTFIADLLVDDEPLAAGGAGLADVHAVVAVLVVGLHDSVSAVLPDLAARGSDAVAAGVL